MTVKPSRKRNARHYACRQKGYKGLVSGYIRDHNNEEVARVVVHDPVERDRWTRLLCDAMNRELRTEAEKTRTLDDLDALVRSIGLPSADLDDAVHDAKSDEAAGINNSGFRDQLDFLLESHSGDVEALKAFLRSLARS